jgi:hypothetical protein
MVECTPSSAASSGIVYRGIGIVGDNRDSGSSFRRWRAVVVHGSARGRGGDIDGMRCVHGFCRRSSRSARV